MKLNLSIDNTLSEIAVLEIFNEITFLKEHNQDYEEDTKFDIINYAIKNGLVHHTNSDFNIEVCNENLGTYKYIFDMWLSELPNTYIAINNKQNFRWDLFEQGYEFIFSFKYQKGCYVITLADFVTEKKIRNSQDEIIDIDELKQIIDSTRLIYYNYIKGDLGNVLPGYLELLDFSFDKT